MTESISLPNTANLNADFCHIDMPSLMAELDEFRKKTERLSLLNELHARLAGTVELPSMIEAFSVWLMPLVKHDLVGYHNESRQRSYMYCSCHGPERQRIYKVAEKLFLAQIEDSANGADEDYYVQNWHIGALESSGLMLVLRQDRIITPHEAAVIDEALEVLKEPLQRALDYEDLFRISRIDALTGLANRRVLDECIGRIIADSRRHHRPLTIACLDLDHFKQVNDNFGHAEGDRVLKKVAETFKDMVRSSDVLVRMGGDEFVVVLPETDLASAAILAERLCLAIEQLSIPSGDGEKLGVSIGLSQLRDDMSKEDWLEKTDDLLYQAKKNGRCQVCM